MAYAFTHRTAREPADIIVLAMNNEEAAILEDLLARVGGDVNGPRQVLNRLHTSLQSSGVTRRMYSGSLYWHTPTNETINVEGEPER